MHSLDLIFSKIKKNLKRSAHFRHDSLHSSLEALPHSWLGWLPMLIDTGGIQESFALQIKLASRFCGLDGQNFELMNTSIQFPRACGLALHLKWDQHYIRKAIPIDYLHYSYNSNRSLFTCLVSCHKG